ncbi:hypothetical protein [Aureivirga marina]|uniref:hypothetical protein n=1 Tax=Aureivirga marina TaxID=1182451 RepID=UPI0018C8EB3C|nr:hypothetical protein [Aureivirga marina]
MKKLLLVLLAIIVFSCKPEFSSKNEENYTFDLTFKLYEETAYFNLRLKEQIQKSLKNKKLVNNKDVETYHQLTTDYIKYLDEVNSELIKNQNIQDFIYKYEEFLNKENVEILFFNGEKYNSKAEEFVLKLNQYRDKILKLVKDESLKQKIETRLNTSSMLIQNGEQIFYLNYMYKDQPAISVLTHMKLRQFYLLDYENEFLKNQLINN